MRRSSVRVRLLAPWKPARRLVLRVFCFFGAQKQALKFGFWGLFGVYYKNSNWLFPIVFGGGKNILKRYNRLFLRRLDCVNVNFRRSGWVGMTEPTGNGSDRCMFRDQQGCVGMPLRYNNDKQKKPLFSRGLSVCRLLFNSFSKLKIDENYKEKRRLFY